MTYKSEPFDGQNLELAANNFQIFDHFLVIFVLSTFGAMYVCVRFDSKAISIKPADKIHHDTERRRSTLQPG